MTRQHVLKTDPEVFEAVRTGAKTFEIRFNDRSFAVGDTLHLRETSSTGAAMQAGAALVYTGRAVLRTVSHVLTGYGLADGWCCLSFDQSAAIADARRAGAEQMREAIAHQAEINALYGVHGTTVSTIRAMPLPDDSRAHGERHGTATPGQRAAQLEAIDEFDAAKRGER